VEAVKAVKRTQLYRLTRAQLSSAAPNDVWYDQALEQTIVLFALQDPPWTYLGFSVEGQAKVTDGNVIKLEPVGDELQVHNYGSPTLSSGDGG
jgi:hypothetical protein